MQADLLAGIAFVKQTSSCCQVSCVFINEDEWIFEASSLIQRAQYDSLSLKVTS